MQLRKVILLITSMGLWGSITAAGFISYAAELTPIEVPEVTIVEVEEQIPEREFVYKEIEITTYESIGEFTITAYCPCSKCCGKETGITASGTQAQEGTTVAADINVLPFGTKISIDGVGERIVEDTPADYIVKKYDSRIIDLYFESHQDALEFGKQTIQVSKEIVETVSNELHNIAFYNSRDINNFITVTNEFDEDIDVVDGHVIIDAKSLVGLCSLDLNKAFTLRIHTDDEEVIKEFNRLFRFYVVQE